MTSLALRFTRVRTNLASFLVIVNADTCLIKRMISVSTDLSQLFTLLSVVVIVDVLLFHTGALYLNEQKDRHPDVQ